MKETKKLFNPGDLVVETNQANEETVWEIIRLESTNSTLPTQYLAKRLSDGFERCVGADRIRKYKPATQ